MQRPPSIRLFEQLFLASLAAWVVAQTLTWNFRTSLLRSYPMLAQPILVMTIGLLTITAISLATWYFAARRAALPAKWAAIALGAFSLLGFVLSVPNLLSGAGPSLLANLVSMLASLLCIAAAAMLFRPDAKTWFGEDGFEDHERE